MKKLIIMFFALLTIMPASAQAIKGDMNGDGKLTMSDANAVINIVMGKKKPEEIKTYSDMRIEGKRQEFTDSVVALEPRFDAVEAVADRAPEYVEAVDLGLSVKWASCNLGATKPEEYGDFIAWGETKGYNSGKVLFNWATYKYNDGNIANLIKYCTGSNYGKVDNKTKLDVIDDPASMNWGRKWRLPTPDEVDELLRRCKFEYKVQNGVNGYLVTSMMNGKSIFLPLPGRLIERRYEDEGISGKYWTNETAGNGALTALGQSLSLYYVIINGSIINSYQILATEGRNSGASVRAVCK